MPHTPCCSEAGPMLPQHDGFPARAGKQACTRTSSNWEPTVWKMACVLLLRSRPYAALRGDPVLVPQRAINFINGHL
eukprot:1143456-Pelagomonas_calceolata.AAC.9